MKHVQVETSKIIEAQPDAIYAVVRDYNVGHQAILPRPYFEKMEVEAGGVGEGTVLRLTMRVYGQVSHYHQRVSEPEPGRVIMEADMDSTQWSRFVIDLVDGGKQTKVTIQSSFPVLDGLAGRLQGWIQSSVSRRIFNKELDNLAAYVRDGAQVISNQTQAVSI